MEQINELETLNTPEEETPLEELALPEVVEATKFNEVVETNKKLYARAKKAEEAVKKLKVETPVAQAPKQDSTSDPLESYMKLKSEGMTDTEVLELRSHARALNVDISTLLNNPIFKAGIEAKRAKAQIEQATPNPSGRSLVHGNKDWSNVAMTGTKEEQKAFLDGLLAKKG